ncbi:50S ribosomal protein L34 [Patescibacteria group bacterium]|nr:50S ribosomal protein L34 [Patescibacteria group bacterium]
MKQKGTYQPKTKKRARVHGFLKRMSTALGRKVIKKRRVKGRKHLTISSQK